MQTKQPFERRRPAGAAWIAALALSGAACVTVPAGHALLITGRGGIEGPLGEGVHLVGPYDQAELIDLRQRENDAELHALTADGAELVAGTSLVTWRPAPDELLQLARELGDDPYAVAVEPVVGSAARRILGQLRLDQLDTAHLRAAQAEITRVAAAELRPLHLILESVDLRGVVPASQAVRDEIEATAAVEQEVKAVPDRLRLAAARAAQLRARAAGVADAHAAIESTLGPAILEEARTRAWRGLLESNGTSVITGEGAAALEVSP